jgi:predicted double-glycine peptidase
VENLETEKAKEYKLFTALRPVSLLTTPYISQLGPGADSRHNDCGAAAAAMVLAAYTGTFITPDTFYKKFNISGDPYLTVDHVREALKSEGITTEFRSGLTLNDLFEYLKSEIPIIIPTKYSVLYDAGLTEKPFAGPHFSIVVGMDAKNIYVHDPLFTDPDEGNARPYPLDSFLKAWTETTLISGYSIPQRSVIIPAHPTDAPPTDTPNVKRVRVKVARLNVRQGPGTDNAVTGTVTLNQEFDIRQENGDWGEIDTGRWIHLGYTETIASPVPAPSPEPDRPNPTEPGNGILINVNLATSIPQNPTGTRAAEYLFNDPLIPSTHRNLCGDIVLSMLYETITKKQNTLG